MFSFAFLSLSLSLSVSVSLSLSFSVEVNQARKRVGSWWIGNCKVIVVRRNLSKDWWMIPVFPTFAQTFFILWTLNNVVIFFKNKWFWFPKPFVILAIWRVLLQRIALRQTGLLLSSGVGISKACLECPVHLGPRMISCSNPRPT